MPLADGRRLGWTEFGEGDGPSVLLVHGTPGTRHQLVVDEPGSPQPSRCFSMDRPGYGLSSFHPARTFTSWAHDVKAFADHVGIERFCVLGFSGGGPNALACAAVLGDRVIGTALVSSVPPKPAGARRPGPVLAVRRRLGAELQIRLQRRAPNRALDDFVRGLPPPDAALLGRPEVRRRFYEDLATPSSTAAKAVAQDRALSSRDWGLDLSRITGTVHIWHGTEDRSVPFAAAGVLQAVLPDAAFHEMAGHGHFFVFDRFTEIVGALVTPRDAAEAT
jgi:pimeloyl-ACP methyl ester carboxylesterase